MNALLQKIRRVAIAEECGRRDVETEEEYAFRVVNWAILDLVNDFGMIEFNGIPEPVCDQCGESLVSNETDPFRKGWLLCETCGARMKFVKKNALLRDMLGEHFTSACEIKEEEKEERASMYKQELCERKEEARIDRLEEDEQLLQARKRRRVEKWQELHCAPGRNGFLVGWRMMHRCVRCNGTFEEGGERPLCLRPGPVPKWEPVAEFIPL